MGFLMLIPFPGGKPKVTDGPFEEVKEVVGGYWVIHRAARSEVSAGADSRPVIRLDRYLSPEMVAALSSWSWTPGS